MPPLEKVELYNLLPRQHHCKRNMGIILRCCHGNRLYLIIRIYQCSWLHLPQNHQCMYSWSLQLCQCSWHWSHMYASPVHTHQYLQMVHSEWIYVIKCFCWPMNFVDLRFCLPMQFNPSTSSRYPTSQLQKKLPMVLLHLCSHPPFAVSHSSMSRVQENTSLHVHYICRHFQMISKLTKYCS